VILAWTSYTGFIVLVLFIVAKTGKEKRTHGERVDHVRRETLERSTDPFRLDNFQEHVEHIPPS